MRRPTTSNTKVYPHLEHFTPEQHAIVRRLTFDASYPHAHQTAHIAARAFCAMHLCSPVEGPKIVMLMTLGHPEGYLPDESYERAAKAVGVSEIVDGPCWRVAADPRVKQAAKVRQRRQEILDTMKSLRDEIEALPKTCPHLNKKHYPRATAYDQPWDECEDCKEIWGG